MKTDKQSIAKITTVKELQTEAAKQFWGNFSDYVNNNIKDFSGQIADSMYEFIVSRAEEILQIVERVPVSETDGLRYFITSHLRFKHYSSQTQGHRGGSGVPHSGYASKLALKRAMLPDDLGINPTGSTLKFHNLLCLNAPLWESWSVCLETDALSWYVG